MMIRRNQLAVAFVAAVLPLTACGGGSETSEAPASAAEAASPNVAPNEREPAGTPGLARAADAIVQVQSSTYEDYEVDGASVRLEVREGVELTGSECLIIEAATGSDHPDARFVLVEADGTETAC